MNLDAQMIISISEADKDFSCVARIADSYGRVVIIKDNKPKYLLIDLEQESLFYDLTDEAWHIVKPYYNCRLHELYIHIGGNLHFSFRKAMQPSSSLLIVYISLVYNIYTRKNRWLLSMACAVPGKYDILNKIYICVSYTENLSE